MTVDTITKPCWVSCDSLWPRHFEDQRPDAWQHEGRPETSFLLSFVQETLGNIYYYSFLLPLYRSQSGEESGADGGCSPELSLCRSFKHSVCLPLTLLLSLILCLSLHYHSSCKCKLSMSFCENNDYQESSFQPFHRFTPHPQPNSFLYLDLFIFNPVFITCDNSVDNDNNSVYVCACNDR